MKTHLLVVDDDNDIREMLAMYLTGLGYAVRQARSGDEGLEYFRNRGPFGCVISDYQMPGSKIKDGVAMLAAIRAEAPGQKCIIQSASWNLAELMEAVGLSDVLILHKPYSRVEMKESLVKMGVPTDYDEKPRHIQSADALAPDGDGKKFLDDICALALSPEMAKKVPYEPEPYLDDGTDGIIQGWKK
jgi:DNA-binding NtrC family response regulator